MSSLHATALPALTQADHLDRACRRLRQLTRKLLRRYPPVQGRDSLEDVLQQSMTRLRNAITAAKPTTPVEYVAVAAREMRRELIDIVQQYRGGKGPGVLLSTQEHAPPKTQPEGEAASAEQGRCAAWLAFHTKVDELSDEARQMFDFLWYHAVSPAETARTLGLDERALQCRWQSARLALFELLGGQLPPED